MRLPEVMLAAPAEDLPPEGSYAFEAKWDGFRCLIARTEDGSVLMRSRKGTDLMAGFPEIAASARQDLPRSVVLDGELVIWHQDRLAFERLLRRLNRRPAAVAAQAQATPAQFVAFDLLTLDGTDLRPLPYRQRRTRLEAFFTEHQIGPVWTLCPMTLQRSQALDWMREWAPAGIEGIVAKRLDGPYKSRARTWIKVRVRHTTEAVVGAVTGTRTRPGILLLGRYDAQVGRLRFTGRTTVLGEDAARQVGGLLAPAQAGHPWTGWTFCAGWGSTDILDVTLVSPQLVVEVSADIARDTADRWRHPVRLVRARPDLTVTDVPLLTATGDA
ncbi:ATP-dependent DNA ligase [Streptomyces xiangluensis]|uniref:ATP-dependent DNA ligase n=1 Tax=Streptomyces xiangluensis TaxID=2665720 RepID=A0ABV8YU75_9ACTN